MLLLSLTQKPEVVQSTQELLVDLMERWTTGSI
jgi:hypothetical protein